jgi:medium-chain acyl-[acyl-carrier-protein] hydrolase
LGAVGHVRERAVPADLWLRRCGGSARPAMRLICLPYAGTGASMFNDWDLPEELAAEVWAVQPPGRENRWGEAPLRRVEPVVREIARAVRPLLDRPFALFGHSMGALLAFELCRELRRSGDPMPVRLMVSAHRAPDLPPWRPEASTLPDPEFLARLDEMAGPSAAVPRDPQVLLLLAPLIRADFELCERYEHTAGPPLGVPLSCFAAVDDPEVRVDEMVDWRRHTTGECRLHPFRGGHLFLRERRPEVVRLVAEDLLA